MVSQTLPLAVTLLPAPSRCPCSALPEGHQTNTYKPNCCPFAAHMYLTPSCTASSPSPSAEGADTTAATHHQSHQQMLVVPGTPLGLAWAIAPDYRAEGQTANFLPVLSVGPAPHRCGLCFNAEICFMRHSAPALLSTLRDATSCPSFCSVTIHRSCKLRQCLVVFWTCI